MTNFWRVVNYVIDESDVVLEILDARLIDETRNIEIEEKVAMRGKKLLYVINKCDLADKAMLEEKKRTLRPSIFISATDHLGTTMLRQKILELASLSKVVVGVVGYPNTGKSSVINALSGGGKAPTSSQSGFTKGIQRVRAGPRIMLLDTPGVIPFKEGDAFKLAVIGAIDVSRIKDVESVALELIGRLGGAIERHYGVPQDPDVEKVLESIARKNNKLARGGVPDTAVMARMILQDWQHGKVI
jgi:ribosome biogenesis GTPase A